MGKTTVVLAVSVVVVLGLWACLNKPSGEDSLPNEPNAGEPTLPTGMPGSEPRSALNVEPPQRVTHDESTLTKEQFERLSREQQDKAVQAFVARFWALESAAPGAANPQPQYLSLDLFGRPYVNSITEGQFQQLSPQDQEKAMGEIMESCRQTRSQLNDTIAQARVCVADNDPVRAEAYLIGALERGRELCANKDNMLLTRLVGIACQKSALNEMVALHTRTGNAAKRQRAQGYLQELDAETNEIRSSVPQAAR